MQWIILLTTLKQLIIPDHLAVHSTLHLEKPRFVKKVVSSRNLRRIDMNSFRSDIESSVLLQYQDDLHAVVNNYDEVLRSLLLMNLLPFSLLRLIHCIMISLLERKLLFTLLIVSLMRYSQCLRLNFQLLLR